MKKNTSVYFSSLQELSKAAKMQVGNLKIENTSLYFLFSA